MAPTSGSDCTPKNNGEKVIYIYKYMSRLSSFARYNELSVSITFTNDARNGHLAFEDEPARVLSFIWLLFSRSVLVSLEFVGSLALFCFVVFQHVESTLRVRQILNVATSENLMDTKCGERAGPSRATRPIHSFAKRRFKNCLATRLKRSIVHEPRTNDPISIGTCSNISCKRVLKQTNVPC